jgi:uncharacterized membrane protein YukC
MTNVTSKEAIVLAYLARHKDISESEWQELLDSLQGDAHDLAEKLREARTAGEKAKQEEAKAKNDEALKNRERVGAPKPSSSKSKVKAVTAQPRRQKTLASA